MKSAPTDASIWAITASCASRGEPPPKSSSCSARKPGQTRKACKGASPSFAASISCSSAKSSAGSAAFPIAARKPYSISCSASAASPPAPPPRTSLSSGPTSATTAGPKSFTSICTPSFSSKIIAPTSGCCRSIKSTSAKLAKPRSKKRSRRGCAVRTKPFREPNRNPQRLRRSRNQETVKHRYTNSPPLPQGNDHYVRSRVEFATYHQNAQQIWAETHQVSAIRCTLCVCGTRAHSICLTYCGERTSRKKIGFSVRAELFPEFEQADHRF